MTVPPLVNYIIAQTSALPPFNSLMYEFIMAGNGVMVRSVREGLSVIAPLTNCTIPGLACIAPEFHLQYPKVPQALLQQILNLSQNAAPNEILFHLSWQNSHWQLNIPMQTRDFLSVTRWESSPNILIEIHSHHTMEASFSQTDNEEESGFKIYGVIGKIFSKPTLRLRVGIYHQLFWEIPNSWVFNLPPQISDTILPNDDRQFLL